MGHGILAPPKFAALLRRMAFVVGTGAPPDGPSALEALANGHPQSRIDDLMPPAFKQPSS